MKADMLATIETILVEAGHIAMRARAEAKQYEKPDRSIVTDGDLAVTKMIGEKLQPWLDKGHFWIDEERISAIGSPEQVIGANHEYMWVTDPIDGTVPYANNRNTWGHICGVLRQNEPFLGGLAQPLHDTLLLADGDTAWLIKGAWSGNPVRTELPKPHRKLDRMSFFEIDRPEFDRYFSALKFIECWPQMPEAAVQGQVNLSLGRAVGYNASGYWSIWDIAGGWAVLRSLGLEWHDRSTGASLQKFEPRHFKPTWRMEGDFLACEPSNYAELDGILRKAEAK